ncbi:hypothetical protein L195_g045756, partial [Trifolium pratense]
KLTKQNAYQNLKQSFRASYVSEPVSALEAELQSLLCFRACISFRGSEVQRFRVLNYKNQ